MRLRKKDWQKAWPEYWRSTDNAGHRYAGEEYYSFCANELKLYFPKGRVRALELGCGNGVLFDYLNDCFATYVGLDFSPAMLRKFRMDHSSVSLICADAVEPPIQGCKYDLVFSNGVCQSFDKAMLRRNLQAIHVLLESGGKYLIANIPDAQLRLHNYARALRGDKRTNWAHGIRRMITMKVSGRREWDGIGNWYSREYINDLAEENGFVCQTFSSSIYEYRFHAVLQINPGF